MTTEYGGELSLGQCVPTALQAQVALDGTLGPAITDIEARLAGLVAISIRPPPALADLIANAEALLASLQELLANPLPDVSATLAAIAELEAALGALQLQLAFSASFAASLGAPGIHYYVFAGKAPALGSEMTALLSAGLPGGSPDQQIAGVVLLASDGGAIDALRAVFRG